jgi:hypothetical protein
VAAENAQNVKEIKQMGDLFGQGMNIMQIQRPDCFERILAELGICNCRAGPRSKQTSPRQISEY